MTVEADGTVRHEVVVDLPREQAFWMFADLDRIKPREHNMPSVPIEQTVLEQHAGGDVYDRGVDGSICRWGRVLSSTRQAASRSAGTSARTGRWHPI